MDLYDSLRSPAVFGTFFEDVNTWREWLTVAKLLCGRTDFDAGEMELYRRRTGWDLLPSERIRELMIGGGRRIGKSTLAALLGSHYGVFGDFAKYIRPGEQPRIWIIATNLAQAEIIKKKLSAIFQLTPFLRAQVKRDKTSFIELKNGVIIETKPASFRTTRGFSCALLIMEELQSWRYEADASANVDSEVYGAIKPGMFTIKNSLVVGIGTLFARAGLLYQKYVSAHGNPGSTMFWGPVPTWEANPTITEREFEAELRVQLGDCAYFAEAGIAWREDIETFLPKELIDAAMVPGRVNLPWSPLQRYVAFADPSNLMRKGNDSMALAIGHNENGRVVVDYIDEVIPPADPKMVIERFSAALNEYHVSQVVQDKVSLGWIASDFAAKNIDVIVCEETKSVLYDRFSVLCAKRIVELPDDAKLRLQIENLEKRMLSGGVVKIDHISGAHDDRINVVAGVCAEAAKDENVFINWRLIGDAPDCRPSHDGRDHGGRDGGIQALFAGAGKFFTR